MKVHFNSLWEWSQFAWRQLDVLYVVRTSISIIRVFGFQFPLPDSGYQIPDSNILISNSGCLALGLLPVLLSPCHIVTSRFHCNNLRLTSLQPTPWGLRWCLQLMDTLLGNAKKGANRFKTARFVSQAVSQSTLRPSYSAQLTRTTDSWFYLPETCTKNL